MRNEHEATAPRDGTLWLVVDYESRAYIFELAPDVERAVVVGSLPRADVRVNALGIAPVHFHFEREGAQLLLVPTYDAEVRVNSRLVRGPQPIAGHALVEFAGVRLEATIHFTRPEYTPLPSLDIPERESGIQYLAALPSDTQTTKLALEAFPIVQNLQAGIDTRELPLEQASLWTQTQRIERLDPALQTTQVMERLQVAAAPIQAITQQTQRLERVAPETFFSPKAERTPVMEVRPVRTVPVTAAVAEEQIAPPPPEIPSSPAALGWQDTTAFDLDGLKADLIAEKAPAAPASPAKPTVPRVSVPPVPPSSAPPAVRSVRPPASRAPLRAVERLGTYAKAHPLAVGATALGAALGLALAMVGVAHIAAGPSKSAARPAAAHGADASTLPSASVAAPTAAPSPEPTPIKLAPTAPTPSAAEPPSAPPPSASPAATPPVSATGHLVAGRYVEARAAYHELAIAQPANPAYLALARLLEKRTSNACSGPDAAPSCPEIVP
ncbi:MAG TPA: FHA domain-containing protein [Polyangiaceae bacterium]|nr:FHA domain-containing protein [Polyangiaceae bacterium]